MKEKLKKFKYGIIILIVAIFISIPLTWKNLDVYFDDGIQHIGRAYATHLAMNAKENTAVLFSLAGSYGYSWNLFYGPFSTIMILVCKLVTTTFVKAYKLTLFLGLVFSGFTMYKLVSKITKNKLTGVFSAILYMTMPYHLNDMYIRNSLGEFLSFIFIPLVFLGMYNLFHKEKGDWLLTLGAVGLIITHNLMTAITAIIAFGYLCSNLMYLKDKDILKKLGINVLFILCLSAFYIFPLMSTAFGNEYAVYQNGMMATKDLLVSQALNLKNLIVTANNSTFVFEIGPHILIMLCFSVVAFRRLERKYKKEYIFFFCLGIFSLIMSTNVFPWKVFGDMFSMIQFPWRMLVFSNFCFAIVASINISIVIKNFRLFDVLVISAISVVYIFALQSFIPRTENLKKIEEWDLGYMSGKNNEVMVAMGKGEYFPEKVNKDRFYIASRGEDTILVLEGTGIIEDVEKEGAKLTCKIETLETPTVYEFPYVYYPGYKVTVDGSSVKSYESENGLLAIALTELPKSDVLVEYKGTKLMNFSKVFSCISVFAFGFYIVQEKFKKKIEIDN